MALRVGSSHSKSFSCIVYLFCFNGFSASGDIIYNLLNLSRELTRQPGVMQIYDWEFYGVCYHFDKFCGHRHCDGGDMFLIYQVNSCDHMFKGLCEFMGESLSQGKPPLCHVWWPLV